MKKDLLNMYNDRLSKTNLSSYDEYLILERKKKSYNFFNNNRLKQILATAALLFSSIKEGHLVYTFFIVV